MAGLVEQCVGNTISHQNKVLLPLGGPHSTELAFALLTQQPGLESHVHLKLFSIGAYVTDFAKAVRGEGLK